VFDALRGLIFAVITRFDLPVFMEYAISMERAILGGAILPIVLQRAWFDDTAVGWIERVSVIVHASHFVFFLTLGLVIWYWRPGQFRRYAAAMLAVMFLGLICYLLLPTVPPWMAARDFEVIPPIDRVGMWIYSANIPRVTNALATNPVAAMPSLHAAFPAACSAIALHLFGWRAAWTTAYTVLVAIVVGYLGEHYFVDVLAGWGLAIGVYVATFRTNLYRDRARQPGSLARAIAMGVLLFVASEGFSALRSRLEQPWVPTWAFIERELAGRSPAEQFVRGLRAERDGDLAAARAYFRTASERATTDQRRQEAMLAMARVAPDGP
jgi:membrane-associated phospholipid phosphatase